MHSARLVGPAPMEQGGIFNRNFLVVALVNLFTMIAYYLLFVISSPYALERFHTSPSTAGLVAGLMVIGCLAGRFVTGRLLGLIGLRKTLFGGILLYAGSIALYLVTDTLPLLFLVRFLSGVGVGCIGTVTGTTVAYVVPEAQRGLGISYFSMSTALALALGPFLGIVLLRVCSYETLFLLCLALGCCNALFALGLSGDALPHARGRAGATLFMLRSYIDYRVIPFGLVVMIICLSWGNIQAFIAFHAGERGLAASASLFFLVYAAVILATRPVTGRIFDRRGENVILYPALLLMICGLMVLAEAHSGWTVLFAGLLLGAGFGNFQSTGQAVALTLVPRRRFGQATSTFFIFFDLGIGLGPYLFGFLVPVAGYGGLYLAAAASVALSMPLYYLAHGRKARPHPGIEA